jgi:hypothetical protein
MRILLFGLLACPALLILAFYIYLFKIKNLNYNLIRSRNSEDRNQDATGVETLDQSLWQEQLKFPENLVSFFAKEESESNPEPGRCFDRDNVEPHQNIQEKLGIKGLREAIEFNDYKYAIDYRRFKMVQRYFESKGMIVNKLNIEDGDDQRYSREVENNTSTESSHFAKPEII